MAFNFEDFRAQEGLRVELAQWLHSDIGMIVMRVMRHRYRPYDVPNDASGITSARILSQFHGAHTVLDDLELLAMPPAQNAAPESSFDAQDTDHYRMPPDDALIPVVRPPIVEEEADAQ